MPDVSNIRLQYHELWTVKEDGSPGEMEFQTEPVWTDTKSDVSFRTWESVQEYLESVEASAGPSSGNQGLTMAETGSGDDLGVEASEETGLEESVG